MISVSIGNKNYIYKYLSKIFYAHTTYHLWNEMFVHVVLSLFWLCAHHFESFFQLAEEAMKKAKKSELPSITAIASSLLKKSGLKKKCTRNEVPKNEVD